MYVEFLISFCLLGVILSALVAYLLGSVNFAIVISALAKKGDVRNHGSGNAGATNMLRTYGAKLGGITFVCDIIKGVLACGAAYLLGLLLYGAPVWGLVYVGALAVIIGHMFPLYFSFKGGKGISTSLGALLFIDWRLALLVLAVFIVAFVLTRMVSVGSIAGAISAPILVFIFGNNLWTGEQKMAALFGVAVIAIMAALIVIKHGANIKRIFNGTESRISLGKKKNQAK